MTDLNVGMISCIQREAARAATVPQFEALGLTPRVFTSPCAPAGPRGNLEVSRRVVAWAAKVGGHLLFIEDDIDLAPDFIWHLEQAIELDSVTYLYLNDTVSRMKLQLGSDLSRQIVRQRPIERGPRHIKRPVALFGTQCVFIPERLIPRTLEVVDQPERHADSPEPFDGKLHIWLSKDASEKVYTTIPHPVQHRQDRTAREETSRVMRSLSFGNPYMLDDGTASHRAHPRTFSIY